MTARLLFCCLGLYILTACNYSGMGLGGKQCDPDNRPCPEGYQCVPDANGGAVCRPESWDAGVTCQTNEDCDDGNPCSADFCLDARCQYTDFPDGLNCNDHNPCTSEDTCQQGSCRGREKDCSVFDGPCTEGACDESDGECWDRPADEGGACDDGLYCTTDDACRAGVCTGVAVLCSDDDPCTRDECNEGDQTCDHFLEPVPGAEGFDQGDSCTNSLDDDCDGSVDADDPNCRNCSEDSQCDDGNPCTQDGCQNDQCVNQVYPDDTVCDDGLYCTILDRCQAGVCQGQARDCSEVVSVCQSAMCVESADSCRSQDKPDGTPCDDHLFCTMGDECTSGECGGVLRDCDDGDFCTADSCSDAAQSCQHMVNPIPGAEGPPDNPSCMNQIDDDCDGLTDLEDPNCEGCTADEQCNDANQCTQDSCVNYQCQNNPLTDGSTCDDGFLCTESDNCQAGVCGGAAVDCSGLDEACLFGVCNPTTGLCQTQPKPDQTPCEDGLACTVASECLAGDCQGGTPKDCSHLDSECTLGTCNPSNGQCQAQPANIGGSCGDPSEGQCDNPDSCDDQGGCLPNHLPASVRCVADDLVSCDGSGNVVESLTCPLGCNPDATPERCYLLNPSNIDDAGRSAAGLDPLLCASTQPFDFGSTGDLCIKTDEAVNPFYDCALDQPVPELQPEVINVISQDSGPEILALSYSSINIPPGLNIFVRGNRVLVMLACGDAAVSGQIWPNAPDRNAGPGGGMGGRAREDGSAWGTGGYGRKGPGSADDWPSPGGGGGGFGDTGGRGGNTLNKAPNRATGGAGGDAYANPELIPLIGGGGGGGGNDEALGDGGATRGGYGGGGGGGLQISVGGQLTIEDGGGINAAGAGGQGAWGMGAGGGGAGAGGAILLEAAGLQLSGILAANGGGGGGGGTTGAENGDAGRFDAQPAGGGSGQGSDGSSGGDGGAGTSASGQNGHLAGWDSGGGGGGAGRIRLNTAAPEALNIDAQAIISPSDSPGPADADCTNLCTTGVVSIW